MVSSREQPVLSFRMDAGVINFKVFVEEKQEKKELFAIGKAAKKAGVSRQSLQYYLMLGLLEPAEITSTGRRLFDQKTVEKIKLIKNLNESGYTLRAIRELFFHQRGK